MESSSATLSPWGCSSPVSHPCHHPSAGPPPGQGTRSLPPPLPICHRLSPHPGHCPSVLSSLHELLGGLGEGAEVLPAEGCQEHGTGQVDGGVVVAGGHGAAGQAHGADGGDHLLRLVGRGVRARDLLVDLKEEKGGVVAPTGGLGGKRDEVEVLRGKGDLGGGVKQGTAGWVRGHLPGEVH